MSSTAELRPLLSRVGADVCQRIAGAWAGRITAVVGTSEESTVPLLRRALVQAGEAAEYGARVGAGPAVYHYGDLGVYHLLLLPLADGPGWRVMSKPNSGRCWSTTRTAGPRWCPR